MLKTLARLLFFLVFCVVTVWTFLVPDAEAAFMNPGLARVFFWHFPCSVLLLAYMFVALYFSFRVFRRLGPGFPPVDSPYERAQWDMRAESAMELGFIWSCLTMATGILFSLVEWGAVWQWDLRQTSFLIALLMYGAYFALRNATADPERRAHYSAAYALAAALPIFFLVIVYPRLPGVEANSFHPTRTIQDGLLKGAYGYVTTVMVTMMTILSIWLYQMRTRASMLALELEFKNGKLEASGGGTAPTSVVRPVPVSGKDGSAT